MLTSLLLELAHKRQAHSLLLQPRAQLQNLSLAHCVRMLVLAASTRLLAKRPLVNMQAAKLRCIHRSYASCSPK
jgi:hypothetical protein